MKALVRRLVKVFLALVLSGVLAIATLLASMRLEHEAETTLPMPTGPFSVGRVTAIWAFNAASDPSATVPGAKRELAFWIWYPAETATTRSTTAEYLPAHWRAAFEGFPGPLIGKFLTRNLSKDRLPPDRRQRVVIRGASHFLFSDDGALLKSHIVMRALRLSGVVGIDGSRQLAAAAYCVHSFFDIYIGQASSSPVRNPSPDYPEIQVLQTR